MLVLYNTMLKKYQDIQNKRNLQKSKKLKT